MFRRRTGCRNPTTIHWFDPLTGSDSAGVAETTAKPSTRQTRQRTQVSSSMSQAPRGQAEQPCSKRPDRNRVDELSPRSKTPPYAENEISRAGPAILADPAGRLSPLAGRSALSPAPPAPPAPPRPPAPPVRPGHRCRPGHHSRPGHRCRPDHRLRFLLRPGRRPSWRFRWVRLVVALLCPHPAANMARGSTAMETMRVIKT